MNEQPLGQVVGGMPFGEYLATDALSKSGMMDFAISPAQYRYAPGKEATPAMRKGSAVDKLWLEGDGAFAESFAEMPSNIKQKRGKAWESFAEGLGGRDVLTSKQWDMAHRIARKLDAHEEAAEIKAKCSSQVSLFWQNQWGWPCKARPDLMTTDMDSSELLLADLKVTADVGLDAFQRTISSFRYHWQSEHYLRGATACTGRLYERFVFIIVRAEPVHSVECYEVAPMALDLARRELDALQKRHSFLAKLDRWPGTSGRKSHEQLCDVQGWYRARAEKEL